MTLFKKRVFSPHIANAVYKDKLVFESEVRGVKSSACLFRKWSKMVLIPFLNSRSADNFKEDIEVQEVQNGPQVSREE